MFQTPPDETVAVVEAALAAGYRHIDTAAAYAQRTRGRRGDPPLRPRPRRGVHRDQGLDQRLRLRRRPCTPSTRAPASSASTRSTCSSCTRRCPASSTGRSTPTGRWRRCWPTARSARSGSATSWPTTSTRLLDATSVVPAVNQIEVHPYFRQPRRAGGRRRARHPHPGVVADRRHHLLPRRRAHGSTLEDPTIGEIAAAHGKTPAQVMLRWHLQQGRSAIPKSVTPGADRRELRRLRLRAHRRGARRDRRARHRRPRRPGAGGDHPRGLRPRDPRGLRRSGMHVLATHPHGKNPIRAVHRRCLAGPSRLTEGGRPADDRGEGPLRTGSAHGLALACPRPDAPRDPGHRLGPVPRRREGRTAPRADGVLPARRGALARSRPDAFMEHLAMLDNADDPTATTTWLEHVSDDVPGETPSQRSSEGGVFVGRAHGICCTNGNLDCRRRRRRGSPPRANNSVARPAHTSSGPRTALRPAHQPPAWYREACVRPDRATPMPGSRPVTGEERR